MENKLEKRSDSSGQGLNVDYNYGMENGLLEKMQLIFVIGPYVAQCMQY